MFEYIAVEDDELSLKVGDMITDIKKSDEGWYEGFLRGRRGVFPDNFVQIRPVKTILQPEIPKAVLPLEIPKAVVPEMRGMESKAKQRRAKVAYSYQAENLDELTLVPGQIVDVITEEEAGWWKGSLGGKVGVFPSNFVEEIAEEPKLEPQRADTKPLVPDTVRLLQVDGVKLPASIAPVPPSAVAPQDTRIDETDLPLDPAPKNGLKVMPMFDPTKVKLKPAGPPTAPPPSADPRKPIKAPEKAKVVADHIATRPEELDVKVGEIVDVVLVGDKSGVIPDNVAEMLTPGKKPLPKEPPKLPFKRVPDPPKVAVQEPEPSSDLTESLGVPRTAPVLDTTAVQSRPRHITRPPSSTKLPGVEAPVESTPVAPWQEEVKKRVVKPPHPPPPGAASSSGPAGSSPSVPFAAAPSNVPVPAVSTGPPAAPPKPKPPVVKVDTKAPQPALSSDKLVEKFEQDKTLDKLVTNLPVPSDDALKDAMEKIEKLSEAFEKFKAEMIDKFEKQRTQYRKEMDTLTRDLDEERKKHAANVIEVDRLKKTVADIRDK
eukprot:Em0023g946a